MVFCVANPKLDTSDNIVFLFAFCRHCDLTLERMLRPYCSQIVSKSCDAVNELPIDVLDLIALCKVSTCDQFFDKRIFLVMKGPDGDLGQNTFSVMSPGVVVVVTTLAGPFRTMT